MTPYQSELHPRDGLTLTQQLPANSKTSYRRNRAVYYRYGSDRARRSIRGINEQITKAEKAVDGKITVKRSQVRSYGTD